MNVTMPRRSGTVIELPATAPMVRLTAGVGSAGQKTWNLRRPVTLIGSRRPAHIVLHDRDVSSAHCVIVNTGTDVLLKDLHTSKGTRCNNDPVDLAVLSDGDVINVGSAKVQIAIKTPEIENDDSGYGVEFVEPTRFANPLRLRLEHTDMQWHIEEAVTLIGRHQDAPIRLENEDVSTRHAVVFKFANGPAIFDLGSRSGVSANAEPFTVAGLQSGDRIGIGPYTLLLVCAANTSSVELTSSAGEGIEKAPDGLKEEAALALTSGEAPKETPARNRTPAADSAAPLDSAGDLIETVAKEDPVPTLGEIKSELSTLQTSIAESWKRLNAWQSQLRDDANKLDKRDNDLAEREAEIDAKDAALRGHLHDITRYHEQIVEREKELAAQAARIQDDRDKVTSARAEQAKKQAEVERRAAELKRREHVVAQRWARLLAATCPHCGQKLRIGTDASADGAL